MSIFQVVFFTASIILLVINVFQFNKYQEGRKPGGTPYPMRWFYFILTSLVAIGAIINIIIVWL